MRWRALALAASLSTSLAISFAPTSFAERPVSAPAAVRTVTLPTGDRVWLTGDGAAHVQPAPGRERVGFLQTGDGDAHTVTPLDVRADIARGRLDERRFRVGGRRAAAPRRTAAEHVLKARTIDLDGRSVLAAWSVTSYDDPGFGRWNARSDEELRLPPGRYAVYALIDTPRNGRPEPARAFIMNPDVRLDRDVSLTLDARQGRRAGLAVERPTARASYVALGLATRAAPGSGYAYQHTTVLLPHGAEAYVGLTAPSPDVLFNIRGAFHEPRIRLDAEGARPFPVEVSYVRGSPAYLGTHRQEAVYGGTGDSARLGDVTDRLVILDLPEGEDAQVPARVGEVARAGGRAVLLVGSAPPRSTGDLQLPTLFTSDPEGRRLRELAAQGPATVTTRGIEASPYRYDLFHPTVGRVPDDPLYHVRDEDLAAATVRYRGPGGPVAAVYSGGAVFQGEEFGGMGEELSLPTVRTEYFPAAPDVRYGRTLLGPGNAPYLVAAARGYRPGERLTETFLKGVQGPSFTTAPERRKGQLRPAWAFRRADTVDVSVPVFSDTEPGHYGAAWTDLEPSAGSTRLYRDGALVGETTMPGRGVFTVPPGPGRYRLDVEANVDEPTWSAPTGIRSSWTFRSTSTATATPLPLMAVQYAPDLDHLNRAPAGQVLTIPVQVHHQPGAASARVTSLVVKASFDDGRTWRHLRVRAEQGRWVASVTNPAQGHVSLRAHAVDTDGNTVTQTTLRAYPVH